MAKSKAAPENETKRERFIRVASARARKAIAAIELMGAVFNGPAYECSDDDYFAFSSAVETALGACAPGVDQSKKGGFSF